MSFTWEHIPSSVTGLVPDKRILAFWTILNSVL